MTANGYTMGAGEERDMKHTSYDDRMDEAASIRVREYRANFKTPTGESIEDLKQVIEHSKLWLANFDKGIFEDSYASDTLLHKEVLASKMKTAIYWYNLLSDEHRDAK